MKTCEAPECDRRKVAKGYCGSHYNQWKRKGAVTVIHSTPEKRFWSKVDKSNECWTWTAWIQPDGYGLFRLDGKMRKPHRVSWEWANGPIPDGMEVDHLCWDRACVRVSHMRLADHRSNGQNRRGPQSNSTTGIRGVSWDKEAGKYAASAKLNGRQKRIGRYTTAEEAEQAVIAWRRENMPNSLMDRSRGVK